MNACNCWIGVVSKFQVDAGVAGGYLQFDHGRAGPLERMREGDGVCLYSPREARPGGAPVRAFTAIGRVRDGRVRQASDPSGLPVFRLGVDYLPASPAPVKPLIERLAFIRSKTHWGAAFRYGTVRIAEPDFALILAAMGCAAAAGAPAAAPAIST